MDSRVQWRGRRRLLAVAVFVLYLVASAHCLDAERAVGGRKKKAKHEIKGPIKTLVVLVMENRSFDHMLGWLRAKGGRPDIDGLTGRESNHLKASDPSSPEVFVSDGAAYVDYDPGHSFQAIREQIFGSDDTSAVPAPMSGFAQQAESMGEGFSGTVMRGFAPEAVPVYSALAEEFAVFDRWFASVPASTQPNRFYVHSATSHGASSNVRRDLIHGFPRRPSSIPSMRMASASASTTRTSPPCSSSRACGSSSTSSSSTATSSPSSCTPSRAGCLTTWSSSNTTST
ncbi:unnamed protein product [Musa textilis]